MTKILTWCKSGLYVWHRDEYKKAFNILMYSQIATMLGIVGLSFTNLHGLIGAMSLLFGIQIGAYATLRLIDEHEKNK
jgi:hypothetical protein